MSQHHLEVKTDPVLHRICDWAYRGTCSCGSNSGPGHTSMKRVRRWYYNHKEETSG